MCVDLRESVSGEVTVINAIVIQDFNLTVLQNLVTIIMNVGALTTVTCTMQFVKTKWVHLLVFARKVKLKI